MAEYAVNGEILSASTSPGQVFRETFTGATPDTGNTGATTDGRIEIDLNSLLARNFVKLVPEQDDCLTRPSRRLTVHRTWSIRLNIVIQVVGSRGDVQPFLALGQELQKYGHCVRIATHDCFESFVLESKLQFYPIGGDPKELMAYMVRNPGLIPSIKSFREGDVQRKREMVAEILQGCWKSCVEPDLVSKQPFVAEVIIANPPSFAHVHCAQALGIPVHMMFTMPWTSTKAFPHPLANFKGGAVKPALMNYASYGVVDFLTWQGLADVINQFRLSIDLEPVPTAVGPVLASVLKVPFTYCWSPALVPKPSEWGSHIDVCGFFFRDPPKYSPPADIERFLQTGPKPVYIGFGSIVVDDAPKMTDTILEAVRAAGVRAIISRGWSNLGESVLDSDDVLFIGDCPHEWLFQHVAAVVHHGGAGTSACGLRNGCATAVVPFFGDQPFWGNMIAAAGAGPTPIPHKSLTKENLSNAISFCLMDETKSAAQTISARMIDERGVEAAVQSFHANLPLETMQCSLLPNSAASWALKKSVLKFSKLAARILIDKKLITQDDLLSHATHRIIIQNKRWDPVTSTWSASIGVVNDMGSATKDLVLRPYRELSRSRSAPPPERPHPARVAGNMAAGTLKAFTSFNLALLKGAVVDIPLATTEGFRNAPALYGEQVRDHGEVTGIRSGFIVAAKTFTHGMADGFSDPFVQPIRRGKAEGPLGVAKGLGTGFGGLLTKTSAAMVGIVAYPGEGISKRLQYLVKAETRKNVRSRRLAEGEYLARTEEAAAVSLQIVKTFQDRTTSA